MIGILNTMMCSSSSPQLQRSRGRGGAWGLPSWPRFVVCWCCGWLIVIGLVTHHPGVSAASSTTTTSASSSSSSSVWRKPAFSSSSAGKKKNQQQPEQQKQPAKENTASSNSNKNIVGNPNNSNDLSNNNNNNLDEPWRARKEWWKDPLALFDDNDELIDIEEERDGGAASSSKETPSLTANAEQEEQVEVDENFILPMMDMDDRNDKPKMETELFQLKTAANTASMEQEPQVGEEISDDEKEEEEQNEVAVKPLATSVFVEATKSQPPLVPAVPVVKSDTAAMETTTTTATTQPDVARFAVDSIRSATTTTPAGEPLVLNHNSEMTSQQPLPRRPQEPLQQQQPLQPPQPQSMQPLPSAVASATSIPVPVVTSPVPSQYYESTVVVPTQPLSATTSSSDASAIRVDPPAFTATLPPVDPMLSFPSSTSTTTATTTSTPPLSALPPPKTAIPAMTTMTTSGPMVLPAVSTTAMPNPYHQQPQALPIVLPTMGALLSTFPAVKVLAVFAIGKAIISGIYLPQQQLASDWPPVTSSSSKQQQASDRDNELESSNRKRSGTKREDDSDGMMTTKQSRTGALSARQQQQQRSTGLLTSVSSSSSNSNSLSSKTSSGPGGWAHQLVSWFGSRNDADEEKLPPARQLMDEVESLRKRAETAEQERQVMEREYEKTSWQLQEAQNELSSLTSTTRYLKAQLRDNEEMMDRAIRAERRKAKEELLRLKDAMLEVVERERQAMREELTRQAEEVQALLREGLSSKNSYPA